MRESITLNRVANSILQRRKKYDNFILVEGSLDRIFFLKFKKENSQVEIAFGWENIIELLRKLKEQGYDKAIGIIDRDLKDLVPVNIELEEEVVKTDFHDINILTIDKCFEIVFQSYSSQEKSDLFKEYRKCDSIKNYTFEIVENLSYLRLLNHREVLNLSFKTNDGKKNRLDYSKFIDKDEYKFTTLEKMIETIINFSRNKTTEKILQNNVILARLENLKLKEKFEFTIFSNGHDFAEIICLGLKKTLGSRDIEPESFLKDCVLSYESIDFIKTEMYQMIKLLEIKKGTEFLKV